MLRSGCSLLPPKGEFSIHVFFVFALAIYLPHYYCCLDASGLCGPAVPGGPRMPVSCLAVTSPFLPICRRPGFGRYTRSGFVSCLHVDVGAWARRPRAGAVPVPR